jgi:hypothetical protein
MKKLLIVSALIAAVGLAKPASGQTDSEQPAAQPTAPVACPRLNVGGVAEANAGDTVIIAAGIIGGGAAANYTYDWTVSDGLINMGQGTSSIAIDTQDFPGKSITATLTLGGELPQNCEATGSWSFNIRQKPRPAVKLDEFGTVKPAEESAKLDNFALGLQDDPTTTGYLIIYGGKTSLPADFKKRATALMTYLVSSRAVNNSRLRTIDGGYREQPFVELWIMPEGGLRPVATPTIPDPNKGIKPPAPKSTPAVKKK